MSPTQPAPDAQPADPGTRSCHPIDPRDLTTADARCDAVRTAASEVGRRVCFAKLTRIAAWRMTLPNRTMASLVEDAVACAKAARMGRRTELETACWHLRKAATEAESSARWAHTACADSLRRVYASLDRAEAA